MKKHDKEKTKPSHGRHAVGAQHDNKQFADAENFGKINSQEFAEQHSGAIIGLNPSIDQQFVPEIDAKEVAASSPNKQQYSDNVPNSPNTIQPLGAFDADGWQGGSFTPESSSRKRKALKVLRIILTSILGLILIAYVAGCIFFMERFFPDTTMGTYDVSMMTASEAQSALGDGLQEYQLNVEGKDLSFTIVAKDAGLVLDSGTVIASALEDTKPWRWPIELHAHHDESDKLIATYNSSGLEDFVRSKVETYNVDAVQPTNATVAYDDVTKKFVIVPEVLGTALDAQAVLNVIDEAVVIMGTTAKITDGELLNASVLRGNPDLRLACDSANTMITADLQLMMEGSKAAEIGPDLVSSWVTFPEGAIAVLNEEALTTWVDELATACSTLGTSRTYTRPDGKAVTVAGGSYGWSVDRDALLTLIKEGVAAGQKGEIQMPTTQVGAVYTAAGERDWGNRYVDVDLAEQYARMYDSNGAVIWESAIVTGKPDGTHDTPTGVYMLNSKASPSKLIGYENGKKIYETPVDFWMPFVGNAIGFHDATWQASFGGTRYRDGAGSHGCVNLPYSAAQELYGILAPGDPVICHF